MIEINDLNVLSKNIRRRIIQMADYCDGDVQWGGALSCVDMLAVLFGNYLNVIDSKLNFEEKDKFILSKGQSAIALYATLAECGIITKEYLSTFQQNGSILAELAIMDDKHCVECSSGSLGLGLSLGVGLAILAKRKNYSYKTIVMLGDGECNEGSVWEAIMLAGQLKIDNLKIIVDVNGLQSDGKTKEIISNVNLKNRLEVFGWNVYEIDGHDHKECLESLKKKADIPQALLMNTIKGKGISFMEHNNEWHHKILKNDLLEKARKEVGI